MSLKPVNNKREQRPYRILDAAARLMAHYGYDKTTMDDIAREAGVSKGAIYLEWSCKEELFDTLFEYEMKKLLMDLRSRISDDSEVTVAGLYAQTLLSIQNSPLITALYTRDGKILGDFVHRQNPDRYTKRLLMSNESVRSLQAAGLLRSDISAEVITYLFSLMAFGMLTISGVFLAEEAPPINKTVEAIASMVERGLALPDGDTSFMKQTTIQMLDLMVKQYEERGKNEN